MRLFFLFLLSLLSFKNVVFASLFQAPYYNLHQTIKSYTVENYSCRGPNKQRLQVIRSFRYRMQQELNLLAIDVDSLKTQIITSSQCFRTSAFTDSPYFLAWNKTYVRDGIEHALKTNMGGTFLTIDLCPSKKQGLDSKLFPFLINDIFKQSSREPLEIHFSISGSWMRRHPRDFEQLLRWRDQGIFNITWVNHSNTHPFHQNIPSVENFLLSPGVDPIKEVLGLEKELIEHGELPSPFFRFPGLISSPEWIKNLKDFGLIPLGADAWPAKNQKPRQGSIILLHGNGNEPLGIKRFILWIEEIKALGPFLPLNKLLESP